MFRNVSNLTLIIILAILAAIYLGVSVFNKSSRQSSLSKNLVDFDPEKVTAFEILAPEDSVFLVRENGDWKLKLKEGKIVDAEDKAAANALESLLKIKPSRLATKNKENWKDYEVDESGTRVKVFVKGKTVADLVIGRFGMNQRPGSQPMYGGMGQFYSFVRLAEKPEVYAANDFMSYSVPSNSASYRNKVLLNVERDSIAGIHFTYPADSSFSLIRSEGTWMAGDMEADSAAVASYLSDIRYQSQNEFADQYDRQSLGQPSLKAEIKMKGEDDVSLEAFLAPGQTWILSSSKNENLFKADSATIAEIFPGKGMFIR